MKKVANTILILAITASASATTNPVKKEIKVSESTIEWKGTKVLGSHTGTIDLKEGYLEMDGDMLTGGTFVVDMTSMECTDLKGENKGKLEGHLKSDDFFGVNKYATSTLVITKAKKTDSGYAVTGDLTIKGQTHPVNFDLTVDGNNAMAKVVIDRTKYGIRYGSGSFFDNLGDNTISDDFELNVKLAM
jgi:polyisoprenoid-binding protein YceI